MTKQSPFKFLSPYEKGDADLFFGRDEEVETLYDKTFDTRLIVFFGASGTGKTSMVRCGLANKFPETRWQELYIRRDDNINAAILRELNARLQPYDLKKEIQDPLKGLELLEKHSFKPTFITFDQFEEIFILQPSLKEQERFFQFLQNLLEQPLSCKVILVMREEFIANLWDFEHLLPSIFDNRFRIRQLEEIQVKLVVKETLLALAQQGKIKIAAVEEIADAIWGKLSESRSGTGLTYLQVLLDRLYREEEKKNEGIPLISLDAVNALKNFDDLIGDFLDEQLAMLEEKIGKPGMPIKILGELVSDERTKKVLLQEILQDIQTKYGLTEAEMNLCMSTFREMRIIKEYES